MPMKMSMNPLTVAAVYIVCLFGFVIWVGLVISWVFFAGVKPPLAAG